jgi:hypothetical protein
MFKFWVVVIGLIIGVSNAFAQEQNKEEKLKACMSGPVMVLGYQGREGGRGTGAVPRSRWRLAREVPEWPRERKLSDVCHRIHRRQRYGDGTVLHRSTFEPQLQGDNGDRPG